MLSQWNSIMIGVADLDAALALWVDAIGFKVLKKFIGDDIGLGRQWNLQSSSFSRQVVLGKMDDTFGKLHLVEMHHPGPSVRKEAAVTDSCIKNIDIYVTDIEKRIIDLQARGYNFRSATYSEVVAPDGTRFREIHLEIHDAINLVLLELPDKNFSFNQLGFGSIGPIVSVVKDVAQEKKFYREILGLEMLTDNFLQGEEIEKMIGLPSGSGLDVSIWGRQGKESAQLELVEYVGVQGKTLFPFSKLPNSGLHQVCYQTEEAALLASQANSMGLSIFQCGKIETLSGSGECWTLYSPAGMRIDLLSPS